MVSVKVQSTVFINVQTLIAYTVPLL